MMKVPLWGGHFTMKGIEFGTDGIHISLNSVLWPRLSSTKPWLPHEQLPNKTTNLFSFYFQLALNEEHSMVEVYIKMNAN